MDVDAIIVISLREAEERRKILIENWKHNSIKLDFLIVERNKNPKIGCFESHMEVLKMAYAKNYSKVLVLEDDAKPVYNMEKVIRITNRALKWLDKNKPNWKYYLMGYFPIRSSKTDNKEILNIKCGFLAHAYIVNMDNKPEIHKWNGVQVDNVLFCGIKNQAQMLVRNKTFKQNGTDIYGAFPMTVIQNAKYSQINEIHLWVQEHLLHKVGQDNMAELSCHFNLYHLLVTFTLFVLLTAILIPLSVFNYKFPKFYIAYVIFYIIILSLLIAGFFI